jgi:hypothetical protein
MRSGREVRAQEQHLTGPEGLQGLRNSIDIGQTRPMQSNKKIRSVERRHHANAIAKRVLLQPR